MFERDVLQTGINRDYVNKEREIQQGSGKDIPDSNIAKRSLLLDSNGRKPNLQKPLVGLTLPMPSSASKVGSDAIYRDYSVIGSAISQWDTAKIIRGVNWDVLEDRERFGEPDPEFNLISRVRDTDLGLTDREFEWLKNRSPRNDEELNFLLDYLREDRKDAQVLGNHPFQAFIYGMVDPVYMIGGGVAGSAGKAYKLGRLGSAALGGGTDLALTALASEYNPDLNYTDVVANGVLGFALGGLTGGSNKNIDPSIREHYAPDSPIKGSTVRDTPTDGVTLPEGVKDAPEASNKPVYTYTSAEGINIPVTNKEPKGLDGLLDELRSNVGGYHDGTVPEWTKDGNKITIVQQGKTNDQISYTHPTYQAMPDSEVRIDVNGQHYVTTTNKWKYDTPDATSDVKGIRDEDVKVNGGYTNPNSWPFMKDGDWRTRVDDVGLPDYKDINWDHTTRGYHTLKDSAFHALYKLMLDKKTPEILKKIVQRMLISSGETLQYVPLRTVYKKRVPKSGSVTFGVYDTVKNSITINRYPHRREDSWWTTIHEAMHAITYRKLEYGRRNLDTRHGKLYQELETLRKHVLEQYRNNEKIRQALGEAATRDKFDIEYALQNVHEFMSRTMELGDPQYNSMVKLLSMVDVPEAIRKTDTLNVKSGIQALANIFRKLLGLDIEEGNALLKAMNIADELLDMPHMSIGFLNGTERSIKLNSKVLKKEVMDATIEEGEVMAKKGLAHTFGNKVAWNAFKTIHKFDPKFADMFLNDPLGTNPGNVQQIRQARRTWFIDKYRTVWEEKLREAMADMGIRARDYFINPGKVREAQNSIARNVADAMAEIEAGVYNPRRYSKSTQEIVKAMDDFGKDAAKQLVDAGLLPPEVLKGNGGYMPRRWNGLKIQDIVNDLADKYFDGDQTKALNYMGEQMGKSIRYEGISDKLRFEYGRALIQRALAQAENTDLIYRGHLGLETAYEVRRILEARGVDPKDIDRVLGVVTGKIEEAGKESWQKSRMDLDMTHDLVMPDGDLVKVSELMDRENIFQSMARYLEDTSGRLALAEKGLKTTADIENTKRDLVAKFMKGGMTKSHAEQLAEDLFNSTLGRPVGEVMHTWGRIISGMTQMMALRNSGFWQVTELAKAYLRGLMTQGFTNTNKFMIKAFKDYKAVADPANARNLEHILSRKSWNEVRLRPFVDMYEDHHAIKSNRLSAFQHATSSVYHINGMAMVQRIQANFAANILVANLEEATRGNTKLRSYLAKFGLDDAKLDAVKAEIDKHGLYVDKWDNNVWKDVDVALTSIMDTDVLRSNLGDVPLFFQMSTVGKILGTFQNFTLTSHNKIMANTLVNDGIKGYAALLAFQLPLAMLATQVSSVSGGRGFIEDPFEWVTNSMAQMGAIGLFVEGVNMATGNSKGVGGAMTISLDKTQDVFSKAMQGDFTGALESASRNMPLISLLPGWGLAISTIKEIGEE